MKTDKEIDAIFDKVEAEIKAITSNYDVEIGVYEGELKIVHCCSADTTVYWFERELVRL